jgi:hypothetical protein
MLSYQWQGIEEAIGRISALADLRGLDSELEGAGDDIAKEARVEPPERPNQRYIRKHKLSGSWHRSPARRTAGAVEVDVSNPTEYGPFVQGEDQAEIHRGRWKKLKTIGEDQRGAIRARVQSWALRTWRGG